MQKMVFPYLEFFFLFERKPEFFEKNLIVPTALISVLSEMTFLLPSQSGEKVGFSVTVFLSLCVNLLVIASHVPASSESFPIIGQYYLMCIFLIAVSIAQTTIILSVHFTGEQYFVKPVPPLLQKVFFRVIGPIVGYNYPKFGPRIGNHIVNESAINESKSSSSLNSCHSSYNVKIPMMASTKNSGQAFSVIDNPVAKNGTNSQDILKNKTLQIRNLKNRAFSSRSNQTSIEVPSYDTKNVVAEAAHVIKNPEFSSQFNEKIQQGEDKLKEISNTVELILQYMQEFQRTNEIRVNRFRLMEDWKLLSKILDRMSAIIYGTITTGFTIYFMYTCRNRPFYELEK